LEAAALLDAPFSPELLGRLLGESSTEAAVDALESRGYLNARWATGDLILRHRLIGETLVDGMSPARRRGLHRRAALALAGARGSAAERIERIAGHRLAAVMQSGRVDSPEDPAGDGRAEPGPSGLAIFDEASAEDLRAAVDALLRAGRQALERHAARRAAGHHRRALALLARLPAAEAERWIDADEGLGDALNQLGAFEAAIVHYRAAFARPIGSSPAERRGKADLARRIGRLLGWGAHYDEALGWMARGLDLLGEQLDEPGRGLAALIQIHSGAIHYYRGDLDEAVGHIQRGLGLAEGSAYRQALATGYNALGTVHDAKGLRDRAIEAYARSLELWHEQGDSYQAARVADNLGICRFHLGQWEAAAEHHRQALDFFEALEDRDQAAFAGLNLGNVFLARGEWEAARQHFSRALARGEEVGSPRLQLIARINLGLLGLEASDFEAARQGLNLALELQTKFEISDFEAEILCARARLALAEGHVETAERLARLALEAARGMDLALEEGAAHAILGAALSAADQHGPARQHLRWAIGILDGLAQAHEAARARLAGAMAAHRAGQREEASLLLSEARQRFESLGASADLVRSIRLAQEWEQSDVA
jgi:tetratricopeptide (TPR) repeat protein